MVPRWFLFFFLAHYAQRACIYRTTTQLSVCHWANRSQEMFHKKRSSKSNNNGSSVEVTSRFQYIHTGFASPGFSREPLLCLTLMMTNQALILQQKGPLEVTTRSCCPSFLILRLPSITSPASLLVIDPELVQLFATGLALFPASLSLTYSGQGLVWAFPCR